MIWAWLRHGADGRVRLHHKVLVVSLHLAMLVGWIFVEYLPVELRLAAQRERIRREYAFASWRAAQLPRRYRREAERILRRTRRRYPWAAGLSASIASPIGMGNDGQRAYDLATRTWFGNLIGSVISTVGHPWYDVTAPTFLGGAKGDNITNDGPSEQAAANKAANDGGGLVYYPRPLVAYLSAQTIAINTAKVGLRGDGSVFTRLTQSFTGDRFRIQDVPFNAFEEGGFYGGLWIDGVGGGAGSVGFHYGDIIGGTIDDLHISNYSGVGSKGAWIDNRANWTERTICHRMWSDNNKIGVLWDVNGGMNSHGYQNWNWLTLNTNNGQVGIQGQNNAAVYHGSLVLRGNISESGAGADVWIINDTAQWGSANFASSFDIGVEGNGGVPRGLTMNGTSLLAGSGKIDFAAMPCSRAVGAVIFFSGYFACPGIVPSGAFGPLYVAGNGGINMLVDNQSTTTKRTRIDFLSQGIAQFLLLVDRNGTNVQDFALFDAIAGAIRWFVDADGTFNLGVPKHLAATGGTAPTANTNLGVNITSVTVTGNDLRGQLAILVAAGGLAANTRICTVTYALAFATAPSPMVVNQTSAAGLAVVSFYTAANAVGTFDLFCDQALVPGTYIVRYLVIS